MALTSPASSATRPATTRWATPPPRALADARKTVANVLGCRPGEVTFTSGGTEADNLAVKGIALARQAADPALNRVVISAVEHPAVEESARYLERFHGFTVDVVPVDSNGPVTAEALPPCCGPKRRWSASCTPTTRWGRSSP